MPQSIELFRTFPVVVSIVGMLLIFFVVRVLSAFVIGTFIWLIFSDNSGRIKISIIICIVVLAAEYLLFVKISDTSSLNYLKYFNLFILVTPRVFLTQYLNLNILGAAVNIRTIGLLFGIIIGVGSTNFIAFKEKYGYPEYQSNCMAQFIDFSQKKSSALCAVCQA